MQKWKIHKGAVKLLKIYQNIEQENKKMKQIREKNHKGPIHKSSTNWGFRKRAKKTEEHKLFERKKLKNVELYKSSHWKGYGILSQSYIVLIEEIHLKLKQQEINTLLLQTLKSYN